MLSGLFLSLLPLLLQALFIIGCLHFWHSSCVIQLPTGLFFLCPLSICLELKSHMSFSFWDSSLLKVTLLHLCRLYQTSFLAPLLLHSLLPPLLHCSPYFRNRDYMQSLEMWSLQKCCALSHIEPLARLSHVPMRVSPSGFQPDTVCLPERCFLMSGDISLSYLQEGCYCHLVGGDQGCVNSFHSKELPGLDGSAAKAEKPRFFYISSSIIPNFQLWQRHLLLWQTALDPSSCGLGEVPLHCAMKMPSRCTSIITAQVMYYYSFIVFLIN